MEEIKIFTEEPEKELWRTLLQYSYKANILRYFEEKNIPKKQSDDELSNCIAGAFLQASEYYRASKNVSLQVEPLLLYYGTTNLFYALTVLLSAEIPQINNHGMKIIANSSNRFIGNTQICFNHQDDGGIHIYSKHLDFLVNLCDYGAFQLIEFIDSIAEIKDDYERCYRDSSDSHILPVEIIKTPDMNVHKITLKNKELDYTFDMIEEFKSAYLNPSVISSTGLHSQVVLNEKMAGTKILKYSYSGHPYLQVGHDKKGKLLTIPNAINMYVALFSLGSICRYHPEIWNKFVTQDSTGEKLMFEKLLYYSRRILPNIVLNKLQNKNISFVSDKYTPDDRIHLVGEHEVKEIVKNEVNLQLKQNLAKKIREI